MAKSKMPVQTLTMPTIGYSAMKEVQAAVKAKIEADAPLMSKIDGIYDYAAGDECIPYVTFGTKTQTPWDVFRSKGWEVLLVLDIWTWILSSGDIHFDILDDLCRLFNGPLLTLQTYHNAWCNIEWSTTLLDEPNNIRHTVARLRTLNEPLVEQIT